MHEDDPFNLNGKSKMKPLPNNITNVLRRDALRQSYKSTDTLRNMGLGKKLNRMQEEKTMNNNIDTIYAKLDKQARFPDEADSSDEEFCKGVNRDRILELEASEIKNCTSTLLDTWKAKGGHVKLNNSDEE